MTAVIVVLGSVLVLFDIPPAILIAGTIIAGVVVMIASGSLALSELKPSNWRKKTVEKKQQVPAPKKAEKTKRFLGLAQFASSLRAGVRRFTTKEKDTSTHIKKIDEQLDKALDESPGKTPAATPKAPAPGGGGGGSMDPFMALSNAKLEEDLVIDPNLDMNLELDQGLDLNQNREIKPLEPLASVDDAAKLDLALDTETSGDIPLDTEEADADEVAAILKSNGEESGDLGEIGGLKDLGTDLDSLGEMDLGAIDLEKEMGLDANVTNGTSAAAPSGAPSPSPVAKTQEVAAPAPLAETPPAMAFSNQTDMAAFAAGPTGGGDDLMAALKADAGAVQQKRDLSLLRDMKDYKTNAGDLARELEDAVSILKSKK